MNSVNERNWNFEEKRTYGAQVSDRCGVYNATVSLGREIIFQSCGTLLL